MKRLTLVLLAAVLLGTACSKKEPTKAELNQAAGFAAEADFAIQIKEYARAEDLLLKATELAPESAEYWLALGTVRVSAGKKSEAKKPYEKTLSIYKDRYKKEPGDGAILMQQVYVLALLGRVDDARSTLEKAAATYPTNSQIKGFIANKTLDQMLQDPAFKALAI